MQKISTMDTTKYNFLKGLRPDRFFLMAGPCVIEDETSPLFIAETLKNICQKLDIPLVFKGSYRKANRSRLDSFTGIGDEKALKVLQKISKELELPVVTDIHAAEEAAMAAEYVDELITINTDSIRIETLPGVGKDGPSPYGFNLSYYYHDEAATKELVSEMFDEEVMK